MLDETEIDESQLDSDIAISDDDLTLETGGHTVEGVGLEDGNEGLIARDEGFNIEDEGINIEDEGLTNAFIESNRRQSFLPLLKEELRMKIQVKRLSEGKDELQIKVEEPPVYELTEEEREKIFYRREQNRRASERKRQKERYHEERFKKVIDILSVENNKLSRLKSKLLRTKAILEGRLSRYKDCKCGKQTTYSVTLIKPVPVTISERSDVTYHVLPSGSKYHTTCCTTNIGNGKTTTATLLPKSVQAMSYHHGNRAISKPISCQFPSNEQEYETKNYNVIPVTQTKDSVTMVKPLNNNDPIYNAPFIVSSKLKFQNTGHSNNYLDKNRTAKTNKVINTNVYSQGFKFSDASSDDTLTEKERQLLSDISEVLENEKEITPKLNIPNTVFDVL